MFKIQKHVPLPGATAIIKTGRKSQFDECEFEKMQVNDSIVLKRFPVGITIDAKERYSINNAVRRVIKSKALNPKDFKIVIRPTQRNIEYRIYKMN